MSSSQTSNLVLMPASDTLLTKNKVINTTFFSYNNKKVQVLEDMPMNRYLQLAMFKNNLIWLTDNNEEPFYAEDGDRTDTIQRAQYRLTPTWRLIKTPSGRFGLIAAKDDESLMSDVQLEQAVFRFERTLSEISTLRHLLTHNRQLEQKEISKRQKATNLPLNNPQQERNLSNNQIGKVMAKKANLSVSVTPNSHQFNQLLIATKKLINTQANQNKLSLDYINKMRPGAPIPIAIMKNLHKHPDKTISTTTIRTPIVEQKNNKTPFNLTPSPFNY